MSDQPRLKLSLKMPPRTVETAPETQSSQSAPQTLSFKIPLKTNNTSSSPKPSSTSPMVDGVAEAKEEVAPPQTLSLKLPLKPTASSPSTSLVNNEEKLKEASPQVLSFKLPVRNDASYGQTDGNDAMEIDTPPEHSQKLSLKLPFKSSTPTSKVEQSSAQQLSLKLPMKPQNDFLPSPTPPSSSSNASRQVSSKNNLVHTIEVSDNTSEGDVIAASSRCLYAITNLINLLDGDEPADPITTMCEAINNYVRELKELQQSGNAAYYKIPRDFVQFAETGENDVSKYTGVKYDHIQATNNAFEEKRAYMNSLRDEINMMIDEDRRNSISSSVVS